MDTKLNCYSLRIDISSYERVALRKAYQLYQIAKKRHIPFNTKYP